MNTHSAAVSIDVAAQADSELIDLVVNGDAQAFAIIMRRYNQLLFRTARSIVKNNAETEDVLQEAYLKAWRALATFRDDAKLSTWLVRIVVNEALGRLRKHSAVVVPLDAHSATIDHEPLDQEKSAHPETQVMRTQARNLLESHIDALPDVFRTVFVLRAVQELSVEETAVALDIPPATVRSRFFRARGLLREAMARDIDVATADAFSFDGAQCNRIVAAVTGHIIAQR